MHPGHPLRRAHLRVALTSAVAALLVLSGCSLGGDPGDSLPEPTLSASPLETTDPGDETTTDDAALERFHEQKVRWRSCEEGAECASIEVPLDYAEPDGKTIKLSVLRRPAGSEKQRVGSLVVNPGGPGGSGVDYAAGAPAHFGPEILQAFDVVGFDPRGVGRSTPVDCVTDAELDTFVAADPDPDTPAELRRSDRLMREFGQGCLERSGDLAAHVSTEEAARDMDVLRAVLGDRRLTYFGASYGTYLGATYADLFPERVGRMVLDGALDPSLSSVELNLVQARGFETALRAYVGSCVDAGSCFLGRSVDVGVRRIQQLLDSVEEQPLPAGSRKLRIGNAVLGVWAPLYSKSNWQYLDTGLKEAFAGNGNTLMALSDFYVSRGPGTYLDNSLEALYAVNCLDQDDAVPLDEVPPLLPQFEEASPTFGAIFAWSLASCHDWPVSTERNTGPLDAEGADPILVVGTTRDPATPLAWAEALAEQLHSGVLVRRDGDGHTGYNAGNDCVDRIVEAYLVSGTVPKGTVDC